METEAKATTWEALLARAQESLFQTGTSNRKLRPRSVPEARFHPTFYRSMELVNADLQEIFRRLCHGAASWPLFLYGPPGSGKTAASLALSDLVQTDWFGTVEQAVDAVVRRDRRRWAHDCHDPFAADPPAGTAPLVVLDEVGARANVSDLEYATVKGFADSRELDFGRVAIYISNLDPNEICRVYDDRVASRMLCGTWFKLDGTDRRMDH